MTEIGSDCAGLMQAETCSIYGVSCGSYRIQSICPKSHCTS